MKWLARFARRMADVIDPPPKPGRHAREVTIVAGALPDGRGMCEPCGVAHLPPLHYYPL